MEHDSSYIPIISVLHLLGNIFSLWVDGYKTDMIIFVGLKKYHTVINKFSVTFHIFTTKRWIKVNLVKQSLNNQVMNMLVIVQSRNKLE